MLKRTILIILIFAISFGYFSNITHAVSHATVYLTSSQEKVNKGEEIEVVVNLKDSKMAACNFSIYFEETKLEFISENAMENINLVGNKVNFVWFDELGGNGAKEGEIVTFKFKAKEEGIVTFTINGEFYNQNGQLIETEFQEKQVQIGKIENALQEQVKEEKGDNSKEANSNLGVLRVDIQGLVPNFQKDVEEYYLVAPKDIQSINVVAISENPNAVVEIKGNTNLKDNVNDIQIQVISADRTQSKVYTIHVSKTDNLELANTNLEILAIENALLNPPFDAFETNYKAEVASGIESLNIFAVPENEKATIQIIGKDNLKEGNNLVIIIVKAQDGFTKKSYKINVHRRTLEEEKKYQEEQEKQKEELENAYKIEKTSTTINNPQEQLIKSQKSSNKAIAIWTISIVIIGLVVWGISCKIKKS